MPRNALIQVRRDTAANWTSLNPTLAAGELGVETDTGKFKIGTGATAWASLLYATDASDITGTTLPSNITSSSLTSVGTLTSLDVNGTTTVRAASTQDGVALAGRAGGSSSYESTLTPTTLTADRTLTLPDASGTAALLEPLIRTSANVAGSGTWWRSPLVPYPASAVTTTFAIGAGVSVPYIFDTRVTISEIGFLSSPITASSTQAKIAIYSTGTADNSPQTRVYESSALTVSGTNQQISLTGISVSLEPGIYWFFIFNTTSGTLALNMIATNLAGTVYAFAPYTSMANALTQANTNGGWSCAFGGATSTSTLVPFGAGTTGTSPNQNWPRMAIRRSA